MKSVIVDSREPAAIQQANYGIPVTVAQLPAGDVMIATNSNELLLIERKTESDLLSSIADGRLFHQITSMVEQTRWTYLVITGSLMCDSTGCVNGTQWRYSSVQGALLTAQELGAFVVFCDGDSDFAACVQRIAKRSRDMLRLQPARPSAALTPCQNLLTTLPGIGLERAVQILSAFPSAAWALAYLSDPHWQSSAVSGVANGTKNRIRQALGLEDGHVLSVIQGDNQQ